MIWYGKDACVAPLLRESRHFSPAWEANAPKEGNEFSRLGMPAFLLWKITTRARGEPAHHHGGDSPLLETPCALQYKRVFRPIVVRARTSSGHDAKQYWLLLRTTTGLLTDQYWSDFPPPTALDLDSADFTLTEQIKVLGLHPYGGRPRH